MTKSQFDKYSELLKRSEQLQNQLNYMNEKAHSNKYSKDIAIHEMGWLNLSYGNGSWNHTVIDNEENVKEISKIIIQMLNKEFVEIKTKMEKV